MDFGRKQGEAYRGVEGETRRKSIKQEGGKGRWRGGRWMDEGGRNDS